MGVQVVADGSLDGDVPAITRRTRRGSVRLRLTTAYSVLFVVAVAAVLGGSYFLVRSSTGGSKTAVSIICAKNGQIQAAFSRVTGSPPQQPSGQQAGVSGHDLSLSETCANTVVKANSGVVVYRAGTKAGPSSVPQFVSAPKGLLPPPDGIGPLIKAVNASRDHTLRIYLLASGIALGIMALLSIALGWWMAGRALKPVHRITDTARRLSERTLHDRINLDGPRDELKELADTFDAMLSRLDQAFTGQRRFVANASHELRTPLATERLLVDEALADPDASVEDLRSILLQIRDSTEESERLINALLTLASSSRGVEQWSAADLGEVVESARNRCEGEAADRGVDVRCKVEPAPTTGDRELLDRLATNLMENAVRHNHRDGWVLVRTGTDAGRAYLEVSNSGPVVEPSVVATLVEPFRRATPDRSSTGEGCGLGLSIVDAIVSAHGARFSIEARPEGGLVVRVDLPERVRELVGV